MSFSNFFENVGVVIMDRQTDLYYPLVADKNTATQLVLPLELLLYSPYTFSQVLHKFSITKIGFLYLIEIGWVRLG